MNDTTTFDRPSFRQRVRLPGRRTKPGARPGTIVADPLAPRPEIRVIGYGPDAVFEQDVAGVEELRPYLNRETVTWINVNGLGDAETIHELGVMFGIHRLALEDIANVHQRAKVEEYDGLVFVVARMVLNNGHQNTEQISLVLGPDFVLSFQERPGDCLEPVRERIRKGGGRLRETQADFLAYALLDAVIDGYFPVLERYGERIEELEAQLFDGVTREATARIHDLRGDLYALRKSIWPHREVVNGLMRDSTPLISEETRMHLRDCYDHAIQIIDIAESCREMCSDLRDFNLTQISIRQNEIMKVLTITATLFIPLSFIAGLYGMNFDRETSRWNMPELGWAYGYPFALGLMGAVAVGMLAFFRMRGWIGRPRGRRQPPVRRTGPSARDEVAVSD